MNLTTQARMGFEVDRGADTISTSNPFLATSPSHMAWAVGRWMAQTGRSMPWDCRTSRGSTMHINGMKVRINYVQGCTEIERIA